MEKGSCRRATFADPEQKNQEKQNQLKQVSQTAVKQLEKCKFTAAGGN